MDLTRATIAAVDSTGQLDEVLGLDEHLEDALWRFDSAQAPAVDAAGGVIVAGMGGSASGGRLAIGALGARLTRPMCVADGYALPGWAGPRRWSSPRGIRATPRRPCRPTTTRRRAAARGSWPRRAGRWPRGRARTACRSCRSRAASSRGRRSATRSSARWRRRRSPGAAPSVRDEVEAAAALVGELVAEWGPDAPRGLAREVDRALAARHRPDDRRAPSWPRRRRIAGSPSSTRTPSCPRSPRRCRSPSHNEVVGWAAAGRSAGSRTSRWRTRRRIRATCCAPSWRRRSPRRAPRR